MVGLLTPEPLGFAEWQLFADWHPANQLQSAAEKSAAQLAANRRVGD